MLDSILRMKHEKKNSFESNASNQIDVNIKIFDELLFLPFMNILKIN